MNTVKKYNLSREEKNLPLEAMRGVAAISVVIWHCLLGFWPGATGVFPDLGLGARPWFGFGVIYGTAAVGFFFVLSGYVLTRAFFFDGSWLSLTRSVLKRWPRLSGPVLTATIFSYALGSSGLYIFYPEVGKTTASPWLMTFGYSEDLIDFTLRKAIGQGLLTFFRGDCWLDPSLWTMKYEFFGSMLAFGLAAVLYVCRRSSAAIIYIFFSLAVICHFVGPNYTAFCVGVLLSLLIPRKSFYLSRFVSIGVLLISIYLLGVTFGGQGQYAWISRLLPSQGWEVYVHAVAGAGLIAVAEGSADVKAALSGRLARWLGDLSFPIYLVHLPVLFSAGCLAFIHAPEGYRPAVAGLVTFVGTFLCSVPLVIANRWWITVVNSAAARFVVASPSTCIGETRHCASPDASGGAI